jgi:2-C-methyl-D-erythritol 4-phosphate cytidylyltransferase
MPTSYFALIPAAGSGSRMGAAIPKQYLPLLGQTILQHTVAAFVNSPLITKTFLVVSSEDQHIESLFPAMSTISARLEILRCGGATRAASVANGLQAISSQVASDDWVMVHDAARPGLHAELIAKLIREIGDDAVGGLLALPVVDTVKRATINSAQQAQVAQTLDRSALWLAQTPQMFRFGLLRDALQAFGNHLDVTDEASAIEMLGHAPRLVVGHPCNLKVTVAADVAIAEMYLRAAQNHVERTV